MPALYQAGWQDDKNLGDAKVLAAVLSDAGICCFTVPLPYLPTASFSLCPVRTVWCASLRSLALDCLHVHGA